jgi:hypothetical protein
MADMDELLKALQGVDPLWSVALVAIAGAVLLAARFWGASPGRLLAVAVPILLVAAAAAGGFYGYSYLEDKRTFEERRALDERAASIFSQTVQPGSVFACLDGSPAPAMMEACERSLFSEPQRVAAAVAIVTQQIAFLDEALQFANARDAGYLQRIEPMRNSVEADPYGFVAYVFAIDHRCTAESCERYRLLRDPARVRENIRVRRFEAFMAKHAPSWRSSAAAPYEPEVRESPLPPGGPRPAVSGVSIGERAGAPVIGDPASASFGAPVAAPAPRDEAVPTTATVSVEPPPAPPAAAEAPPSPPARPQAAGDEKSKQPAATAKSGQPEAAKAAAAKGAPTKSAAKAKADPASRRSSEPVGGLPRVVPRDYIREQDDGSPAQTAGPAASQTPGAPISIAPQQN